MKALSAVVSIRATKEQVWNLLVAPDGFLVASAGLESSDMPPLVDDETIPFKRMVWRRTLTFGAVWGWTAHLRPVHSGFVEFEIRETRTGWFASFSSRDESEAQKDLHRFATTLKQYAEAEAAAVAAVESEIEAEEAAAEPVPESLFFLAANQPPISDYCIPAGYSESGSPAHSPELEIQSMASVVPAAAAPFIALHSSTNDGLLALLMAIPSNPFPQSPAIRPNPPIVHDESNLERPKCRNGHLRSRRRSHARSV